MPSTSFARAREGALSRPLFISVTSEKYNFSSIRRQSSTKVTCMSSKTESTGRKLRILCLHGYLQNAEVCPDTLSFDLPQLICWPSPIRWMTFQNSHAGLPKQDRLTAQGAQVQSRVLVRGCTALGPGRGSRDESCWGHCGAPQSMVDLGGVMH